MSQAKRWVVKIGSALLTADGAGLDQAAIAAWVDQISALRKQGIDIVLVSSGSIAEGMSRLNMRQRPHELHRLQAAAAVGQMGLIQAYESNFQRYQTHTAQILLTHDDLSNRQRYLNARSTIKELLKLGAVPVINENDTVVTDEIRFGDNDSLGALDVLLHTADFVLLVFPGGEVFFLLDEVLAQVVGVVARVVADGVAVRIEIEDAVSGLV